MDINIIVALITSFVQITITVVGFIVTYNFNKKNYIYELRNSKTTLNIEKLQDTILLVSSLMNDSNTLNLETYKQIVSNVFSFGSVDAIKILTYMQTSTNDYNSSSHTPEVVQHHSVVILTLYSLLVTQIKYDLTGEVIPPLSYMKFKLNDFYNYENEYYVENNKIVDELQLNESFKTIQ